MDFFKLPMNAAIVLVDEVALDFGQLRLKGKGGAGGHNGLKSLQAHLKTPEYTRLRIGVGGVWLPMSAMCIPQVTQDTRPLESISKARLLHDEDRARLN